MSLFLLLLFYTNVYSQTLIKPKVVYGLDNRKEFSKIKNTEIRNLASSVAIMIPKKLLVNGDPTFFEFKGKNLVSSLNLCEKDKFNKELSYGDCTGFLIDSQTILTAGHCIVSQEDCEDKYWYFDFYNPTNKNLKIESKNIYSCKNLITTMSNGDVDFAIIRLDRSTDRKALKLNLTKTMKDKQPVYTLGYPMGYSLKFTDHATIESQNSSFYLTNLDTFHGNSGSPVFEPVENTVIGILASGATDFKYNARKSCYEISKCSKNFTKKDNFNCTGEAVLKINKVRF